MHYLPVYILLFLMLLACQSQEDQAWQNAKMSNKLLAIDSFLMVYPDSKYTADAQKLQEEYQWYNAKADNTVYAYKKYLTDYPDGLFSTRVPQQLDSIPKDSLQLSVLSRSTFIGKIDYGQHETKVLAFQFTEIRKDSSGIYFLAKINTSDARKDIEGRINPNSNNISFVENDKDKTMLNLTDGRVYVQGNKILLESTNVHQYWNLLKYTE